jgi:hypothetical protein
MTFRAFCTAHFMHGLARPSPETLQQLVILLELNTASPLHDHIIHRGFAIYAPNKIFVGSCSQSWCVASLLLTQPGSCGPCIPQIALLGCTILTVSGPRALVLMAAMPRCQSRCQTHGLACGQIFQQETLSKRRQPHKVVWMREVCDVMATFSQVIMHLAISFAWSVPHQA